MNGFQCVCLHKRAFYGRVVCFPSSRRVRKMAKNRLLASSGLSVRPHGTTGLPLDRFLLNLSIFRKSVDQIQLGLKYVSSNGYFYMKTIVQS